MKIRKGAVNNTIKVVLALTIIGYLLYFLDPRQIIDAAKQVNPAIALIALALLPVNLFFEHKVWNPFISQIEPTISASTSIKSILLGYSMGIFTPGRLGEFAGRALFFDQHKLRIGISLVAVRLIELSVICLFGLPTILWFASSAYAESMNSTVLNVVIGYSAFIFTLVSLTLIAPRRATDIWGRWVFSGWREKLNVLDFYYNRKDVLRAFSYAVVRFVVYSTQFFFCLKALIHEIPVTLGYAGTTLVFLTKVIIPPVTFMDLGIREGAATFFFSQFGFAHAAAFDAALLLFAINILLPAILGLPLVSKMHVMAK